MCSLFYKNVNFFGQRLNILKYFEDFSLNGSYNVLKEIIRLVILRLDFKYGTNYDRIYTHRQIIRPEVESKIVRLYRHTTEIIRLDG